MLLGIHLTLLIGPTIAVPAPFTLVEALTNVSVTHNDRGRSGFELTFQVGRSGPLDLVDYGLVQNPLLKPFNRVVLMVTFNATPQVLMDGVITEVRFAPSNEPGVSTLTVTGEDLSVMMDLHELNFPWPALSDDNVVRLIILKYAQYTIAPLVIPPIFGNAPSPTEEIPVQKSTDFQQILSLAGRQSYVFYIEPGPLPNMSVAYWGPPIRIGPPQKALSFNMGPETNVLSFSASYNGLATTLVFGSHQDSRTNVSLPIFTVPFSVRPPLALMPSILNQINVRTSLPPTTPEQAEQAVPATANGANGEMNAAGARTINGLSYPEALARAQATVEASMENVVSVSGELDALQYGSILKARGIVGVRGVGFTYDGYYYVKSVSHSISKGEYKQRFSLTREGTGSLTPLVRI
jgi:hypothetical protein